MKVVLDASAAIEIALARKQAARLAGIVAEADVVLAPELFVPEVVNTIWKYHRFENLSLDVCDRALEAALGVVDTLVPSRQIHGEAFLLARTSRQPAYDMFYLALARREDGLLLTIDAALRKGSETPGRPRGIGYHQRSSRIRWTCLAIRFLVEGPASRGSVAVFECDVPAGAKVPVAHRHDAYEETIYGLAGVLTLTVDGPQSDIGPGDAICIPRGAVHRFDNGHSADARMLAIVTPGVPGLIKAAAGGPPDAAALAETMRRHGLTPEP